MAAQNILSVGIDVASFDAQKQQLLNSAIGMFNTLEEYSKKSYSPVLGTGLVEFNTSLKETTALLNNLSGQLTQFTTESANVKKTSTEASLAIQEYNKSATQAAVASAKLAVSTSEQAKETALLKAQLLEANKQLAANARAQTEAGKASDLAKIKSQEYRLEQQRVVESLRSLAVEQDRMIANAEREEVLAVRQATIAATQAQKSRAKEDAIAVAAANSAAAKAEREKTAATKATADQMVAQRSALENIGSGLTKGLSLLRSMAYILPGIGIAGIFNLAFQAIESAAEEIGLFNTKLEDTANKQKAVNDAIREQISLYKSVFEQLKDIESANPYSSKTTLEGIKSTDKAIGFAPDIQLKDDIALASENYNKAKQAVKEIFGSEAQINSALDARKEKLAEIAAQLAKINKIDATISDIRAKDLDKKGDKRTDEQKFRDLDFILKQASDEERKAQRENLNIQLANNQERLKIETDAAREIIETDKKLTEYRLELAKYEAEQRRKLILETAKLESDRAKDTANRTLNFEGSSYQDRINALEKTRLALIKAAEAEKAYALSKPNAKDANGVNTTETAVAIAQADEVIFKANADFTEKSAREFENYRQRKIKAQTEINKNAIEQDAIANERIYKDLNQSLIDRLAAYAKYIDGKQKLQDLEAKLNLDNLAIQAKGDVPAKEREKVISDAEKQKANIQADAQAQVYEIVYSSLKNQLKLVIQANEDENQANQIKYTKELHDLNEAFKKKEISYKTYRDTRRTLDEQYRVAILDNDIEDDEKDIERLNKLLKEKEALLNQFTLKRKLAEDSLNKIEQRGGDVQGAKKTLDTAIGEEKAAADVIIEIRTEVAKKTVKLNDDKLKREKTHFDDLKKFYAQYYNEIKEITDALYTLAKTAVDGEYTTDLERLRRKKEITDQIYGYEKEAIDKSNLSAKDKTALEVQLNAQKAQSDKQAQAQERKLKRDQAIADQKLALAHIAFNTAEGISKALTLLPPADAIVAAEKAALGTIQAITVLATPIPYKKGTPAGGHPGGMARYAEDGIPELVKEPGKSPYLVMEETVSYLPKGTEVIPIKETPEFSQKSGDGWEQTKYLARQIAKSRREIKNVFSPVIKIDLNFEMYKKQILGN